MLPKDFIRLRLGDLVASDVSDASGTALFDVAHRAWSSEMLRDLDVPAEWLPSVHESPAVAGQLSASAADRVDLPVGLPIAAGAGDQAAGAVAAGRGRAGRRARHPGKLRRRLRGHRPAADRFRRAGVHTFCHALPHTWHVMGVTQGAGLSLRWLRDRLVPDVAARAAANGRDPYELLTEEAAESPPGSRGVDLGCLTCKASALRTSIPTPAAFCSA